MRPFIFSTVILAAALAASTRPAEAMGWDSYAGGISGNQLNIELGFSELPRVTFEHQLLQAFPALGVEAGFDYGYWTPQLAFTPGMTLGMPMRVSIYDRGRASVGMRFEPGFLLQFTDPLYFGVLLGIGFNGGGWVALNFLIGGGLEAVPIALVVPTRTGEAAFAYIPLLFGPFFEFHPNHLFGLTFDIKLGPNINSGGGVYLRDEGFDRLRFSLFSNDAAEHRARFVAHDRHTGFGDGNRRGYSPLIVRV